MGLPEHELRPDPPLPWPSPGGAARVTGDPGVKVQECIFLVHDRQHLGQHAHFGYVKLRDVNWSLTVVWWRLWSFSSLARL